MERLTTSRTSSKHIYLAGAGLLIGLFLFSSQIDATSARALSNEDDYFTAPILKRNTWWSKKSLDALDTIQHPEMNRSNSGKCQESLEVYSCYVDKCVQNFVNCARESETGELFAACKMIHKFCASSCANINRDSDIRL